MHADSIHDLRSFQQSTENWLFLAACRQPRGRNLLTPLEILTIRFEESQINSVRRNGYFINIP